MPAHLQGAEESLLTVTDVAGILRLSVRTVRRLIAEDELPIVRIGRAVRVRREDLRSFIDKAARSGQEMKEKTK
jgi:excisionase family DNA binding protein